MGVRYIDRLTGPALDRLDDWIIPQMQSLQGRVEGMTIDHSVNDTLIEVSPLDRLQVRSGLLGPNKAFDPAIPPVSEPAWLLDIDVFTFQAGFPFDPKALAAKVRGYAETAYSFFRFATTDAFHEDHTS